MKTSLFTTAILAITYQATARPAKESPSMTPLNNKARGIQDGSVATPLNPIATAKRAVTMSPLEARKAEVTEPIYTDPIATLEARRPSVTDPIIVEPIATVEARQADVTEPSIVEIVTPLKVREAEATEPVVVSEPIETPL